LSVGVYEMGSTFKPFPLRWPSIWQSQLAFADRRPRELTLWPFHHSRFPCDAPDVERARSFHVFIQLGAARMALMAGVEAHKAFLYKMGQLSRLRTELPESAEPLVPKNWGELNTMTIAFGQGLNVAPLQAMMAVGALANGDFSLLQPLEEGRGGCEKGCAARYQAETSESLRYLMRLNAEIGTAKIANIQGYFVGGKTGTADKIIHGHYSKDKVFTTFMAILPSDKPKYLFLTLWTSRKVCPRPAAITPPPIMRFVAGKIIERTGPLLGLPRAPIYQRNRFPLLAKLGYAEANQPAKGGGEH